ncbi:MAG: Hpt domain-containing protein [Pseudomonadota bacterium]|nr:Hpt domain-containing protein [Pseudomonadota bacterium]
MEEPLETSSPESGTKLPTRDETAALAAAGGDMGLAREMLESLLLGLPREMAILSGRFEAEDWPGLGEAAHHMRGATSYCGLPALDTALQDLERSAKAGDAKRIVVRLQQVAQEAERLRAGFPL